MMGPSPSHALRVGYVAANCGRDVEAEIRASALTRALMQEIIG